MEQAMSKGKAGRGVYGVFNGSAVRSAFLSGAGRGGRLVAGRDGDGRLCACDGIALAYVPETARGFWGDRRMAGIMETVRVGGVGSVSGGGVAVAMPDYAIAQIVRDSLRGEVPAAVVLAGDGADDGRVWVGVEDGGCSSCGAWVEGKYAALIGGDGLIAGAYGGLSVGLGGGNESGQYGRVIVRDGVSGDVLLIVAAMVGVLPPSGVWGGGAGVDGAGVAGGAEQGAE
jgi:hypothetical protein